MGDDDAFDTVDHHDNIDYTILFSHFSTSFGIYGTNLVGFLQNCSQTAFSASLDHNFTPNKSFQGSLPLEFSPLHRTVYLDLINIFSLLSDMKYVSILLLLVIPQST